MFRIPRSLALATVSLGLASIALSGCSSTPAESSPTLDPDEKITIDFAYWGNDVRADLYDQSIAAFNEEYPNITVRSSFLAWPEYWEKRQTEAAGGGLPDVMQTDINYLRQYHQSDLLLDLTPYLGSVIDDTTVPESVLANGVIDDEVIGFTISTNALGMFINPTLAEELGVEPFAGGEWADYDEWLASVRDAAKSKGVEAWGGSNYASLQAFELMQRSKGENLFTNDAELNFSREDLTEYWSMGAELVASETVTPQRRLEELRPLTAFDAAEQVSEITWDTMGASYLANLGEAYPTLEIAEPPVTVEGAKDMYKKAGMLLSAAKSTDHPQAAAALIDFLSNSPEVGEIFGTNRGIPASSSALEGAEITGISAQVLEYEKSIASRIGDAPPLPPVGYGPLEQLFRSLGEELSYGTITVDDAVDQLFGEIDVIFE